MTEAPLHTEKAMGQTPNPVQQPKMREMGCSDFETPVLVLRAVFFRRFFCFLFLCLCLWMCLCL